MRKLLGAIVLGAGVLSGGAVQAQSWGVYFGNGGGYGGAYGGGGVTYRDDGGEGDGDRMLDFICSGHRAAQLEDRLRHEVDEGEIDYDTAHRIHSAIDHLEDKQRHECDEGDRHSVRDISRRYDGIDQWIGNEAHGGGPQGW